MDNGISAGGFSVIWRLTLGLSLNRDPGKDLVVVFFGETARDCRGLYPVRIPSFGFADENECGKDASNRQTNGKIKHFLPPVCLVLRLKHAQSE